MRTASGAVLLALVLLAVWLRGPLLMLFVAVAALISAHELYTMARRSGYAPWYPAGLSLALLLALRAYVGEDLGGTVSAGSHVSEAETLVLALVVLLLLLRLAFSWFRAPAIEGTGTESGAAVPVRGPYMAWADTGITVGGALYTGGLIGFAPYLADLPGGSGVGDGRAWLLLVFLGTAACDTGAYLVGSMIGRHKMIPHISPGKTWEGLVGGTLGAIIAAMALSGLLGLALWQAVLLGLLICAAAVSGDLCESLMKRATGVKDSGHIIPGHGGVLDRLDSILFVTLAVYWFVQLVA